MMKKGLKEQVKSGELSPEEAVSMVYKGPWVSQKFVKWLSGAGRRRYNSALSQEPTSSPTMEEVGPKKVNTKKSKK